jgi:cytochrome c-type biogenesis protein CcmF
MSHPMPFFGYVSLILALVLSVYTLFAGALALWAIAHGRQLAVSAERLRETSRRAGIASFIALTCAAFALV